MAVTQHEWCAQGLSRKGPQSGSWGRRKQDFGPARSGNSGFLVFSSKSIVLPDASCVLCLGTRAPEPSQSRSTHVQQEKCSSFMDGLYPTKMRLQRMGGSRLWSFSESD